MPTSAADVPAALSALSIRPLAHCARLGRMRRDHGDGVQPRHRLERLRADQQADVEQDRHDRRHRQQRVEHAEKAEEAEDSDHDAAGQRVAGAAAGVLPARDGRCRPRAGTASRTPSR